MPSSHLSEYVLESLREPKKYPRLEGWLGKPYGSGAAEAIPPQFIMQLGGLAVGAAVLLALIENILRTKVLDKDLRPLEKGAKTKFNKTATSRADNIQAWRDKSFESFLSRLPKPASETLGQLAKEYPQMREAMEGNILALSMLATKDPKRFNEAVERLNLAMEASKSPMSGWPALIGLAVLGTVATFGLYHLMSSFFASRRAAIAQEEARQAREELEEELEKEAQANEINLPPGIREIWGLFKGIFSIPIVGPVVGTALAGLVLLASGYTFYKGWQSSEKKKKSKEEEFLKELRIARLSYPYERLLTRNV